MFLQGISNIDTSLPPLSLGLHHSEGEGCSVPAPHCWEVRCKAVQKITGKRMFEWSYVRCGWGGGGGGGGGGGYYGAYEYHSVHTQSQCSPLPSPVVSHCGASHQLTDDAWPQQWQEAHGCQDCQAFVRDHPPPHC